MKKSTKKPATKPATPKPEGTNTAQAPSPPDQLNMQARVSIDVSRSATVVRFNDLHVARTAPDGDTTIVSGGLCTTRVHGRGLKRLDVGHAFVPLLSALASKLTEAS